VAIKKVHGNKQKIPLYFTPLPKSPQWTDFTKFCTGDRLTDVITCFFVDRLRGLRPAMGQILPFSIDLAGRH